MDAIVELTVNNSKPAKIILQPQKITPLSVFLFNSKCSFVYLVCPLSGKVDTDDSDITLGSRASGSLTNFPSGSLSCFTVAFMRYACLADFFLFLIKPNSYHSAVF